MKIRILLSLFIVFLSCDSGKKIVGNINSSLVTKNCELETPKTPIEKWRKKIFQRFFKKTYSQDKIYYIEFLSHGNDFDQVDIYSYFATNEKILAEFFIDGYEQKIESNMPYSGFGDETVNLILELAESKKFDSLNLLYENEKYAIAGGSKGIINMVIFKNGKIQHLQCFPDFFVPPQW